MFVSFLTPLHTTYRGDKGGGNFLDHVYKHGYNYKAFP
jgi:hypothetical protein